MTATGARSPAAAEPPDGLVARFAEALARLRPDGGRLGLAVSGGPDSLAMLLLAEAAIPGQFEVATVDHGLRADSADECAMVARVCAERGIRCAVLGVEVEDGNVQAKAREARYRALGAWANEAALAAVATAHHADDQAETLLMRLNRGSGVSGLAGVRESEVFPEFALRVIRPLLAFRRADLAQLVEAAGVPAAADPSNRDDRFERVRVRAAIAGADWLDAAGLAASARHLADADEAIEQFAREIFARLVSSSRNEVRFRATHVAREVQLRVFHWALAELGMKARGQDAARLVDRLRAGRSGNVGGVVVTVEGEEWVFRPEPARRGG